MTSNGSHAKSWSNSISWKATAISYGHSILVPMAISRIDPSQNEFLAGLEARAKQPNPFFRVMAHRPEALKNFVPFYGAVAGPGSLDRRLKEIAYLTASMANRCAFCTAAHTPGAHKAGITG